MSPLTPAEVEGEARGAVLSGPLQVCSTCGSDDLLRGVDEHDVEDGSYECEACGARS